MTQKALYLPQHIATNGFLGRAQLAVILQAQRGEEGQWFRDKMREMGQRIATMPATYGQDGKGAETIAYLHYFTGGADWYITEKDIDTDGEGQHQAYGSANLGWGAERGYISLPEILSAGAELDLHFTPCLLTAVESSLTA